MSQKWMEIARALFGQKETKGDLDNKSIVEMFRLIESPQFKDDEDPWCAAFVGACLELSGYKSTRSASARSYLKHGKELKNPKPGCVVVLWRDRAESSKGHVGFYAGETAETLELLGGNQNNSVSLKSYPKARLLGYRWPTERLPGPAYSPIIPNILELESGQVEKFATAAPDEVSKAGLEFERTGPVEEMEDSTDFGAEGNCWLPRVDLSSGSDQGTDQARVLAPPMIGEDVRSLQLKLKELGYRVGGTDGIYGPMTEAAVFEFQKANGLVGNGVADMETLAALVGGKPPEIAPQRANIDEAQLLEKGSKIIGDARSGRWAAVAAGVLGLFGAGDVKFDVVKTAADSIAGAPDSGGSAATAGGIVDMLPTLLGSKGGVWVGLLGAGAMAWRYFRKAAASHVRDYQTGEDRTV